MESQRSVVQIKWATEKAITIARRGWVIGTNIVPFSWGISRHNCRYEVVHCPSNVTLTSEANVWCPQYFAAQHFKGLQNFPYVLAPWNFIVCEQGGIEPPSSRQNREIPISEYPPILRGWHSRTILSQTQSGLLLQTLLWAIVVYCYRPYCDRTVSFLLKPLAFIKRKE